MDQRNKVEFVSFKNAATDTRDLHKQKAGTEQGTQYSIDDVKTCLILQISQTKSKPGKGLHHKLQSISKEIQTEVVFLP